MPAHIERRQRLIAAAIDIAPQADEYHARKDFFGNNVIESAVHAPHAAIRFTLKARVERLAEDARLDSSPQLSAMASAIASLASLQPDSPHHFMSASNIVRASDTITTFAHDHVSANQSAREAVERLSGAVHAHMRYDSEATDVDTTPDESFARGRGVCQDYTHILIAALRAIGIPAGYVSGFIRTTPPDGQPRLEGADAMHAWVRAWCGPDLGWIEIDPTNAIMAGEDHIIVAYGRDYSDAAPIKGALRMAGSQRSFQAVKVAPVPV